MFRILAIVFLLTISRAQCEETYGDRLKNWWGDVSHKVEEVWHNFRDKVKSWTHSAADKTKQLEHKVEEDFE